MICGYPGDNTHCEYISGTRAGALHVIQKLKHASSVKNTCIIWPETNQLYLNLETIEGEGFIEHQADFIKSGRRWSDTLSFIGSRRVDIVKKEIQEAGDKGKYYSYYIIDRDYEFKNDLFMNFLLLYYDNAETEVYYGWTPDEKSGDETLKGDPPSAVYRTTDTKIIEECERRFQDYIDHATVPEVFASEAASPTANDFESPFTCPICEGQLGHCDHLDAQQVSDMENAQKLGSIVGYLVNQEHYEEATPLCRQVLVFLQRVLGDDHLEIAGVLHYLAFLYGQQRRYEDAVPLHRNALSIREKLLGVDHENVAESCYSLASSYYAQNQFEEALPLLERARAIYRHIFEETGRMDGNLTTLLGNLARTYRRVGRYDEAESVDKEALDLRTGETLGDTEHDVAKNLLNLCIDCRRQGSYAEAQTHGEAALQMMKELFGQEHGEVARCLNSLAAIYADQGRHDEAVRMSEQALSIARTVFEPQSTKVAEYLGNLGYFYSIQDRYDEAEQRLREALRIWQASQDDMHPNMVVPLNNLSMTYVDQKRYREALQLQEHACRIAEQVLSGKHPDLALIRSNLAGIYWNLGRYAEAEALCRSALVDLMTTFGNDHLYFNTIYENLMDLYTSLGRPDKAEEMRVDGFTMPLSLEGFFDNANHTADLDAHEWRFRRAA